MPNADLKKHMLPCSAIIFRPSRAARLPQAALAGTASIPSRLTNTLMSR